MVRVPVRQSVTRERLDSISPAVSAYSSSAPNRSHRVATFERHPHTDLDAPDRAVPRPCSDN